MKTKVYVKVKVLKCFVKCNRRLRPDIFSKTKLDVYYMKIYEKLLNKQKTECF